MNFQFMHGMLRPKNRLIDMAFEIFRGEGRCDDSSRAEPEVAAVLKTAPAERALSVRISREPPWIPHALTHRSKDI